MYVYARVRARCTREEVTRGLHTDTGRIWLANIVRIWPGDTIAYPSGARDNDGCARRMPNPRFDLAKDHGRERVPVRATRDDQQQLGHPEPYGVHLIYV